MDLFDLEQSLIKRKQELVNLYNDLFIELLEVSLPLAAFNKICSKFRLLITSEIQRLQDEFETEVKKLCTL